jgi:hypothetical protein
MPITYRQQGGTRATGTGGQRGISSINGDTGVVTVLVGAIGTVPLVGSIMEIFGTTTKDNKGYYTCTAVSGLTYTLRPKPKAQGTSGTLARTADLPEYTLATGAVQEVLVFSFDTSKAYIRVGSTGNFKTAGVRPNDRVYLSGHTTTANNGAWIVDQVISETVLLVRSPDNGELMVTDAVASGTVRIFHGRVRIEISDVGTNSWNRIASDATPRKGPYFSEFYRFGSGQIKDYIRINEIGDGSTETRNFVQIEGVAVVSFYQSTPSDLTFYSLNEIVVASQTTGTHGGCEFTEISASLWPGSLTVQLGSNPGNRYAAADGSAWIGVPPNARNVVNNVSPSIQVSTKTHTNVYGSYLDLTGVHELSLNEGNVVGSIIRPRTNFGTGRVESLIAYGNEGNAGTGISVLGSGDQNNILLSSQVGQSAVSVAATVSGLLVSDSVFNTPFLNTSGGTVEFRDPREDYDIADIMTNNTGNTIKTYQFNPRFVSKDSPAGTPVPIFYLTVDVIQVNESDPSDPATNIVLIHEVTNTLGYIEKGARYLTRQELSVSEVSTPFSHRVILEGAGYQLVDQIIQLTTPLTGDWAVSRVHPDYEGEFGE